MMLLPDKPVLASTLWESHNSGAIKSVKLSVREPKLATGITSVDNVLQGGFQSAAISCLSAETTHEARRLVDVLIASYLLSEPSSVVILIDTANTIDVRRIFQAIQDHLSTSTTMDVSEQAISLLDRVKIMKAFDFEGLAECISEVQELIPAEQVRSATPEPQGLLILDSITQVTQPLLNNDALQAQALLISYMRSLRHLTVTHNLCTVVINEANQPSRGGANFGCSGFAACKLQPALGESFAEMLDLHVLLHTVPRTVSDAVTVYGNGRQRGIAVPDLLYIFEVLQDRYQGRVGHWAPFAIDVSGRVQSLP